MTKTCAICGNAFEHHLPRTMTCSAQCRRELRLRRERARSREYVRRRGGVSLDALDQKPCLICGQMFTPHQVGVLFCSESCRKERKRRKEKNLRDRAKEKYWQEKEGLTAKPDAQTPFSCPWEDSSLGSLPPGVMSWNDASMTPFM